MLAEQMLREGDILGALNALKINIRKQPENSRYRIFYFQLLALLGLWEKALTQLDVLENLESDTWPMVQTYRMAIQSEVVRAEVFAGRQTPLIFGEPHQWMAFMVEALQLTADGKYDQAVAVRDQAFEMADASSGTIDEQHFEWIADADSRLGPVIELIVNGLYYWVPFSQIRSVNISQPQDLRDLVWLPAQFVWANHGETVGLIPTRYPGSENEQNSALQLSRTTEWREVAGGLHQGLGQRMWATDQNDYSLMEVRSVELG